MMEVNLNELVLSDLDSANRILEIALKDVWNDQELEYDVVIGQTVSPIHIKRYGDKFDDSITGQLARGIWEFQQEIYRAVAYTLHGVASIQKLSREEIDQYNIVFYISAGCTKADGDLKPFLGL